MKNKSKSSYGNDYNKNICKKLFDEIIPDSLNELDESVKFVLLSMVSILNSKNIIESQDFIYENFLTDGGNDIGIDAICFYINGQTIISVDDLSSLKDSDKWEVNIIVNQAKFNRRWSTQVLNEFATYLPLFLKCEITNCNESIESKQEILRVILEKVPVDTVFMLKVFTSNCGDSNELNGNIDYSQAKEALSKALATVDWLKNENISVIELDLDFIKQNVYRKPFTKKIEFKCSLNDSFSEIENDGYVFLVNLYDYYDFITENNILNESLFESNVRDFQNNTNVNTNIFDSINNDVDIDFWWLNNGITIISEKIGNKINNKIELQNPQIINGLQTSYSLFNAVKQKCGQNKELLLKEKNDEKRKVMIKIIQTSNEDKREKIIKASNTQNQMNASTQVANDKVLKSLEIDFKVHDLYFERRKKYYLNRSIDKNKIINQDDVAKYFWSLEKRQPAIAKNRTLIFFNDSEKYKEIFSESNRTNLVQNTVLAINFIKCLTNTNIKSSHFNEKQNISIKIHFKFHLFSLYANYRRNTKIQSNDCDEVVEIVYMRFTNILKEYIDNNLDLVNNYRTISTDKDFQTIMYKKFGI
jgi:hypothetical protein